MIGDAAACAESFTAADMVAGNVHQYDVKHLRKRENINNSQINESSRGTTSSREGEMMRIENGPPVVIYWLEWVSEKFTSCRNSGISGVQDNSQMASVHRSRRVKSGMMLFSNE